MKRPQGALADHFLRNIFAQSFDVPHSQAKSKAEAIFFQLAWPIGTGHVDGPHFQTVPLSIFDNGGRMIKTHGLIIQKRGGECGR